MARPKGSKNKKKFINGDLPLEELIAQRAEAKAALEAERDELAAAVAEQNAKLKEFKSQIKKLDKELSALEEQKTVAAAAAAATAAKEAVQSRVEALLAEGKSLDDIMNLLG